MFSNMFIYYIICTCTKEKKNSLTMAVKKRLKRVGLSFMTVKS